ncbi:MAG: glycosyltransferase family 1 protein [Bacillota bacterium]|nr:glycosyltransferase family 1 protein [Bacillota bacterium]
MKIAIDARGINWYRGTGIGTYTENVLRNLFNIDKSNDYLLFWSGTDYESFSTLNSKVQISSKKYHNFYEDCYFPHSISRNNIDIYHVPQNGIGISQNINCKKVVTIHDLIPYIMPETVGRGYLLKFLREVPRIVNHIDGIITVSEWSKKDILKFFPIDPNKIFVTPLAADIKYKPLDKHCCKQLLQAKYNIDKPFVLYIGGFSPRKNVPSLIKAFSKVCKDSNREYILVLAGAKRDESSTLIKLCDELSISDKVLFTGYIPEQDLPLLYNACEVFVYPSIYEGFGLPPLEAMNCGTPVITSNCSSIPEVVGDGGILLDNLDENTIADSLQLVLFDKKLQGSLSERSLIRSKEFSWKKTAEATLKIYEKIHSLY